MMVQWHVLDPFQLGVQILTPDMCLTDRLGVPEIDLRRFRAPRPRVALTAAAKQGKKAMSGVKIQAWATRQTSPTQPNTDQAAARSAAALPHLMREEAREVRERCPAKHGGDLAIATRLFAAGSGSVAPRRPEWKGTQVASERVHIFPVRDAPLRRRARGHGALRACTTGTTARSELLSAACARSRCAEGKEREW